MTYKIYRSSTPTYLSLHIKLRQSARSLRSSDVPLPDKPTIRTQFAKRSFDILHRLSGTRYLYKFSAVTQLSHYF